MPVVRIQMIEGRDIETKRELARSVTETICKTLDIPAERVRIRLEEMKKEDYAIGGVLVQDQ